ncbi:MAG: hypothetical protein ACR2GN_00425 [Bacteroidia bacterium]
MNKEPVPKIALVQRLKKHLALDGQILKKSRGERSRTEPGQYYTVASNGFTVQRHLHLEKFSRQEKVLSTQLIQK